MHVAMVTDTFETGGGLEQLFQCVKALHGIRFSLLARGGGGGDRFRGLEHAAVYPQGFGRDLVLQVDPDLIHFHHLKPLAHFLWRPHPPRRTPPLLFTAHGLHVRKYDHRPGARSRAGKLLRRQLERRALGLVDRVIAVSREDATFLRSRYGLGNVVCVPNGVDIRSLESTPSHRESLRQELGLPPDASVFLTVARFHFQKGYDVLLEAVRLGRDLFRRRGVFFVWVGDGRERCALQEEAGRALLADRVRFVGERPDAARMMKAADLFVLPSRWEGLPVSLLEALFCGLPVVASNTCGNREAVLDGVNGLLFENGSATALLRALESMTDPARRKALRPCPDGAFRRRHDIANTARALERLYREQAAAGPPGSSP